MERIIKGAKVTFSPLVEEKIKDKYEEFVKSFMHPNNVMCHMCKFPFGLPGTAPMRNVTPSVRMQQRIYVHDQRIGCPASLSPPVII